MGPFEPGDTAGDTAGDSLRSPDSALRNRSAGGSLLSFEFLSGGFLGLLMLNYASRAFLTERSTMRASSPRCDSAVFNEREASSEAGAARR